MKPTKQSDILSVTQSGRTSRRAPYFDPEINAFLINRACTAWLAKNEGRHIKPKS